MGTKDPDRPDFNWGADNDYVEVSQRKIMEMIKELEGADDGHVIFMVGGIRKNPKKGADPEYSMVCRFGVRKGVTGQGMSYDPHDYNNVIVFDMTVDAHRTIWLEGARRLKVRGVKYRAVTL